ncbi:unnamed protein product [Ilex paraguariensis]|uniref:Uncharacterized protein n=1 Tax=Ilex paraguariensis TaxID=185542 RepID=A0ABC8RG70_9AQUA
MDYCSDCGEQSSKSSQREMVDDSNRENLPKKEKMQFHHRKLHLAANQKKGQKVSVDTSASEIIGVNEDAIARRTRRRKV